MGLEPTTRWDAFRDGGLIATLIADIVGPTPPPQPVQSRRQLSPGGGAIGAAAGGIFGLMLARRLGGGIARMLVIAGGLGLAGGIAGALYGSRLLHQAPPERDGRTVGVAHGRERIDNGDGTSTWAAVDKPLILGMPVGTHEGYATLRDAIAATHPNSGTGEMAFVRDGARIDAFTLESPGLKAVESYEATDPIVVAYTTRMSGDLLAGPGATDVERAEYDLR